MKLILAVALVAAVVAVVAAPADRDAAPSEVRRPAAPRIQPAPPRGYRVPKGAIRVSDGRELRAALARRARRTIVLQPGTYRSARPFLNESGHRIYAARVGRSVLEAGVSLGGNTGRGGALLRGVVIDVADPRRTVGGAAIAVWGRGRGSSILDTALRGRRVLTAGVEARTPDGMRISRVTVRGFTDYGVLADANEPMRSEPADRFVIEDLDVADVERPVPGSSDGRAEACLWVGDRGTVRRARLRTCGWSGLWTGTAVRDARFEGIDVDGTRTGVYLEHFTSDSTFTGLRVGPDVRIGLNAEWAAPEWDSEPASVGNVIERSHFESRLAGVYLDEGTTRTTVRDSSFAGQRWAAIGDYRGRGNEYHDNDYRGIAAGAQQVSRGHLSSAREG